MIGDGAGVDTNVRQGRSVFFTPVEGSHYPGPYYRSSRTYEFDRDTSRRMTIGEGSEWGQTKRFCGLLEYDIKRLLNDLRCFSLCLYFTMPCTVCVLCLLIFCTRCDSSVFRNYMYLV